MRLTLKYFILAFIFCSCNENHPGSQNKGDEILQIIAHLKWLTGTWKSVSNEGILYEVWKKENDSLISGQGFLISGTDTLFSEKLELQQKGKDLFYVATVKGQNNEQPVSFKFIEFNKGEFNFVNKDHDFPQRIIYKNPQPDFLCTRIEGTKNGKFRKSDSNFLKVK
jgi:hypothetical protein